MLNKGTFSKLLSCTDTLETCKSAFGPKIQGKMVEPKNPYTNRLIFEEAKSIFGFHFHYWIGITNGGDLKYQSDGSSVTWSNFHTGHKRDSFDSYHCVYVYSAAAGKWYSHTPCTRNSNIYTVCEVKTD